LSYSLRQLADRLGAEPQGIADTVQFAAVSSLQAAQATDLTFFANPKYRTQIGASRAGAILVSRTEWDGGLLPIGKPYLVVPDAYAAFCEALEILMPAPPTLQAGRTAMVDPSAILGEGVVVADGAYVGPRTRVGARTVLHPGVVLQADVALGADCELMPNSVVMYGCVLGERVRLQPGVVIGGDGFGYALTQSGMRKIPQRGNVIIEDDVEIGANSAIDRATFGSTRIGQGAKIDNLVQIAHNVKIGPYCVIVAQAGISGSTELGGGVQVGGQAGITGHLKIGDMAQIGGQSGVHHDVDAGARVIGSPAIPDREWFRVMSLTRRLPELWKTLRKTGFRL
jgi:UDP-3-O-[3-hydroxymyristoyl] glucosamine N-acyltransferase